MANARTIWSSIRTCRSCASGNLIEVLDLGETPLADRLLTEAMLEEPEPVCPLTVVFCEDCALVQIKETVKPEVLFDESYPYYSSISPSLLAHFRASATEVMDRRSLNSNSLVIELASNDGYQLKNYHERGIPVLGIDPASGPAARAVEQGIDTKIEFFTEDLADEMAEEGVFADVLHANNVLAHVADTNGFVAGIARLLKEDGEAIIECPYLGDLIEKCEFDTIYHQHLCYFSLSALDVLFRRHKLYVNRVKKIDIHGGSLRIFVGKTDAPDISVRSILDDEVSSGMTGVDYFRGFAGAVRDLRGAVLGMLKELKSDGRSIVGYGAAAKACTFMSYIGIDGRFLDYLVDRNPYKQGKYMTGNKLPIFPVERLSENRPDYILILPWNFSQEIMDQQSEYARNGGKFIVPVPNPTIV